MICHRCWHAFDLGELLSIAESAVLDGDPVLGPAAKLRFRASRFDTDGNAIDPEGSVCHRFACPRCRLPIPRAVIDCEPVLISLLGIPASGKSFLLATATWSLRQLSDRLPITCIDPDPIANALLHDAEARLFRPVRTGELVALDKTEVAGVDRYDGTRLGGQRVSLPRPYVLGLEPDDRTRSPLALVLYDNAGEHHLPTDSSDAAHATGHLRRSATSIILIDPIQHPKMREACTQDDPQVELQSKRSSPPPRQELLISQAASSIRRMRGLREDAPIKHPLILAIGKADAWMHRIPSEIRDRPLLIKRNGEVVLDHEAVAALSAEVRKFVAELAPEITGTAQVLGDEIVYLPISATGHSPVRKNDGDAKAYDLGVRAGELEPRWVAECLLVAVDLSRPGSLFPEQLSLDEDDEDRPNSGTPSEEERNESKGNHLDGG